MIDPIATSLRRLSGLLLALSSSDDPIRDGLQATVNHFSERVSWSTVTVAAGVVLEGVEIIHDVVAWIKRKRREKRELADFREVSKIFPSSETIGNTKSHSDNPKWVKRVLRLGLLLVVIGVVGEWRYGAELDDAQNAVHKYDVAKLTAAAQAAGDAKESAKDAAKAASDAKTSAKEAGKEAEIALDKSNSASRFARSAQEKAEEAKDELSSMEQSLQLRILPYFEYADGTTNIDDLRNVKGETVCIEYVPEFEPLRAAKNLAFLFSSAGWTVKWVKPLPLDDPNIDLYVGLDGVGVDRYSDISGVQTTPEDDRRMRLDEQKSRRAGDTVQKWLIENGWEASAGVAHRGEIPSGAIRVDIYVKPFPLFEDEQAKRLKLRDEQELGVDHGRYKDKEINREVLQFGTFMKSYKRGIQPKSP